MTTDITEQNLITLSGYTQQYLYSLRNGQRVGKYVYPPELEQGKHWYREGRTVLYTKAGKALVMRKAARRRRYTDSGID